MTNFKRESRYIVFKIKDLANYCNTEAMIALRRIGDRISEGRRDHGKPPFNGLVVEQDWPEFEPTWAAIEARFKGEGSAASDAREPEGCKLIAHHTGEGWHLAVENAEGDEVAMLEWPPSWPDSVNADFIRKCGFQVV